MQERQYGDLAVSIHDSKASQGAAVAQAFAEAARRELAESETIAVTLATGNSQLDFIRAVTSRDDIEWSRIRLRHMDEYLGMREDHPASFRRWVRVNVVETVRPHSFEGICADHDPIEEELDRYTNVLRELPPAITVMGIGENGHLAFNDPPADFATRDAIRVVRMDDRSRLQQVGEGHFESIEKTPTHAVSLTIPMLLKARTVLVGAPEARKAEAVRAALEGPVDAACPASILRTQRHAHLYLDTDSAGRLSV